MMTGTIGQSQRKVCFVKISYFTERWCISVLVLYIPINRLFVEVISVVTLWKFQAMLVIFQAVKVSRDSGNTREPSMYSLVDVDDDQQDTATQGNSKNS